ncbi:post-GPI attachment to proteins factor 3-like [Branchiostoma lanceolatum]|uniref:post-GPI attachment to proteins factor 3-like n=1 Tax=Branchiostoma lanceolatum TaxID=7740 RepID=UPI00345444A0
MDILAIVAILSVGLPTCLASLGDRSYHFLTCLQTFESTKCRGAELEHFNANQPRYMRLLGWDCSEECKYECMWETVQAFQRNGQDVPQFYGKWPFVRVLGAQEPASVVFSVLNGLAHLIMVGVFRSRVPKEAPLYWTVNVYALVAVNAWVWSTVFHTRDLVWTERLDYFSATSIILFQLFHCYRRCVGGTWRSVVFGAVLLRLFAGHVYYLSAVKFDYGYNMKAMVTVAVVNGALWLGLAVKNRKQSHMWKCGAAIILVNLFGLLEVGDFPPIWWAFDGHALWHAGTAPVVLLWYSFLIDDCREQLRQTQLKTS